MTESDPMIGCSYRYARGLISCLDDDQKKLWHEALDPRYFPKRRLVNDIIYTNSLPYLDAFVRVISDNHRLNAIHEIFLAVQEILYEDTPIVRIVTADPLTPDEEKVMRDKLDIKNASYIFEHSSEIIAGVIVEHKGFYIDASLLYQVNQLKNKLMEKICQ